MLFRMGLNCLKIWWFIANLLCLSRRVGIKCNYYDDTCEDKEGNEAAKGDL